LHAGKRSVIENDHGIHRGDAKARSTRATEHGIGDDEEKKVATWILDTVLRAGSDTRDRANARNRGTLKGDRNFTSVDATSMPGTSQGHPADLVVGVRRPS